MCRKRKSPADAGTETTPILAQTSMAATDSGIMGMQITMGEIRIQFFSPGISSSSGGMNRESCSETVRARWSRRAVSMPGR